MRPWMSGIVLALAVLATVLAGAPVGAAPAVRTIATVEVDTWFDPTASRVKAEDVLLVGLLPSLTLQAQVSYEQLEGWYGWQFGLGPVVNLTPNLYLVAVYALESYSYGAFSHELDVSLNHETESTALSLGVKADWFPAKPYFYAMPSLGGKFHPIPSLGLFGKIFVAIDQDGRSSGSFWGEAAWNVSRVVALRAGGTMGYSSGFAWSAIAGVNVAITPKIVARYTFKYLAGPIDSAPDSTIRKGIENGLVLDVRL